MEQWKFLPIDAKNCCLCDLYVWNYEHFCKYEQKQQRESERIRRSRRTYVDDVYNYTENNYSYLLDVDETRVK